MKFWFPAELNDDRGEKALPPDDANAPAKTAPLKANANVYAPGRTLREQKAAIRKLSDELLAADRGGDPPPCSLPAGYSYLLQLVGHDLTVSRSLLPPPETSDPALDLGCIYGLGHVTHRRPYQFQRPAGTDPTGYLTLAKLVRRKVTDYDLVRDELGALVADPRNDDTVLISQMHVLFLRFHNHVARHVARTYKLSGEALLAAARQMVREHYDWVIAKDLLARLVDSAVLGEIVEKLLAEAKHKELDVWTRYQAFLKSPALPLEFVYGAMQLGHCLPRDRYDLNEKIVRMPLLQPASAMSPDDTLRGRRVLPVEWTLDWNYFLPLRGDAAKVQYASALGRRVSRQFAQVPTGIGARREALPYSVLLSSLRSETPDGESVQAYYGRPPARTSTSAWVWMMDEAYRSGGNRFGPYAGRLLAETLLFLLKRQKSIVFQTHDGKPRTPEFGRDFNFCKLAELALQWEEDVPPLGLPS